MKQKYTSKNTSINTKRLPAIYNKINWTYVKSKIEYDICKNMETSSLCHLRVVDIGCGRETSHIENMLRKYGFDYYPYDPYWCSEEQNKRALKILMEDEEAVVICSNVLNVIAEPEIVDKIHKMVSTMGASRNQRKLYFITIYEGDKSGNGKESKNGCWQRNEKLYKYRFAKETWERKCDVEILYKGTLTSPAGAYCL